MAASRDWGSTLELSYIGRLEIRCAWFVDRRSGAMTWGYGKRKPRAPLQLLLVAPPGDRRTTADRLYLRTPHGSIVILRPRLVTDLWSSHVVFVVARHSNCVSMRTTAIYDVSNAAWPQPHVQAGYFPSQGLSRPAETHMKSEVC
jgi:hypothetical protein